MKEIMQGNSAIARGAWEAGVKIAAAYPGTPSSEILKEIADNYPDIYAEWATNEKVAMEVALGGAIAGARAIASMKHVGMNVAADPFMTLAYTGVKGGFVIIVADDPSVHSSQNEQGQQELGPVRQGSHARTRRRPGVQGLCEDRLRDQRKIRHTCLCPHGNTRSPLRTHPLSSKTGRNRRSPLGSIRRRHLSMSWCPIT